MGETLEVIVRMGIFVGIAAFMWSVSSSLETIAQELKRQSERAEK